MKTLEVEMKVNLPMESVEEVLITAIEGGSNYWYFMEGEDKSTKWFEEQMKEGKLERNESIHYMWMDALFQGSPHPINIYDIEEVYEYNQELDQCEPIGTLTMDKIKEGLKLAQTEYPKFYAQHFPEYNDGDATSSDVIFQLITLGEVVYG
tara:strand:+ start:166 stop:618 length:453 start_codon:yes stop_codon:yes gene_type:complete